MNAREQKHREYLDLYYGACCFVSAIERQIRNTPLGKCAALYRELYYWQKQQDIYAGTAQSYTVFPFFRKA